MAEKDINEETYPGPTVCSGQIYTNCPMSSSVILLKSLLASLDLNYPENELHNNIIIIALHIPI